MADRYVGDYGQTLSLTTSLDLSGSPTVTLWARKPESGTRVQWSAPTVTPNATPPGGSVSRVHQQGELDEAGLYEIQIVVTRSSPASEIKSDPYYLDVGRRT